MCVNYGVHLVLLCETSAGSSVHLRAFTCPITIKGIQHAGTEGREVCRRRACCEKGERRAGGRRKVKDRGKGGSSREGEVWYSTGHNTTVGMDVVSMCHHGTWTVTSGG